MRLTNESNKLFSLFKDNDCVLPSKFTNKTKNILKILYDNIIDGVSFVKEYKRVIGNKYDLDKKNISNVSHIPRPKMFPFKSLPEQVINHINNNSVSLLVYSIELFNRTIKIIFVLEEELTSSVIKRYNNYVDYMLVWLHIVTTQSNSNCADQLNIYVYHTSLTKTIPETNNGVLNENNVNTAFTSSCSAVSEIVIFRKEEWFKVFIHETFHNFGLDFSDIELTNCHERILRLFPVSSKVNLYESYAEFWARLMNALFCAYIHTNKKDDIKEFLLTAEMYIHFERIYSNFQMVKVLKYMGLTYSNMYEKNSLSDTLRNTLYREDTNVLSYYIITNILMNNYQDFIFWCYTNNMNILKFRNTKRNVSSLCKFIENKYRTKAMLININCVERLLNHLINMKKKSTSQKITYLVNNLRMTMCELG